MPADFDRNVNCLLGLPFDAVDMAAAVDRVRSAAHGGKPCFLFTPNLNFLAACRHDPAFRASVINSDLNIIDGMPLVWVARLLGLPIRTRVAGSDLFEALCRTSEPPVTVFFFGGASGVAERAAKHLNARQGGLRCVGFECPGFGSIAAMSSPGIIERINASGAQFIVVALGARKGQAWIEHNRHRLAAPVVSHLGAVINFVAGTVSRAPGWLRLLGLEWLWRIREEPGLWRRYAQDGAVLLRLLGTRVLPHYLHLQRKRVSAEDLAAARVELSGRHGLVTLTCRGHWSSDNLDRLRPFLRRAAAEGCDIELMLAETDSIDSAVVGLLMIASGMQQRRGKQLRLVGLSRQLRNVLRWQCAEYLLD